MRAAGPGLGRPLPHDSLLHRRNPTVKLAVLLVVSVLVLVPVDPWTPLALYALALPAVAAAGRLPWRVLATAQLAFSPFALSLLLVNSVTRDGRAVASVLGMTMTDVGLTVGASLAVRTLLVGALSVGFVLTTDGARLMTSLHQHARLGPRATYAILAGYRVLEQLPDRWTTIRQAQAVREPARATGRRARRPGALPGSPAALRRAAFTLLVVALRQGERMATAMETRGLGSGPRTVARPVSLDRSDAAFAAVVLDATAAVLLATWRLGVLDTWATVGG